jgi:hypothetical protein
MNTDLLNSVVQVIGCVYTNRFYYSKVTGDSLDQSVDILNPRLVCLSDLVISVLAMVIWRLVYQPWWYSG